MRLSGRVRAAVVSTAAAGLALSAVGVSLASPWGGHGAAGRNGMAFDHLYVIMLENHSRSSVIDDPNAPFITSLAHQYGMADHYYGVTHPSMPNYVASIAGNNFGIQDDNDQNVVHLDRKNLVDQLEGAHVTWAAYMDTLPANKLDRFGPTVDPSVTDSDADPAQPGNQVSLYAKKHNPFVLFDDVKNNPSRMQNVKDYGQLATDLNRGNAPQFVWITPNQCNDMHGGVYASVPGHPETPCPYGSTKDDANDAALKHKADVFVQNAVDTITHSRAWTSRSAIVVVTDENDYTGNPATDGWESADGCCDSPYVEANDPRVPGWSGGTYGGGLIPAIVVTASGPRHFVDHTAYNHYSLLTTIEDNWNLGHLEYAGDSTHGVVPMWPLFVGRR